ncbi:MAG TPA: HD domain-containing phosphohydrolase [Ideonella sp.]|uniref:HD-GYP domain-containing protein n=1 Tax=Ideonella sp. TaxID=1929293 RepID=UPI002E328BDF|nr:HD domain-containing phosphohydrolase [Ideonella sp.]HEX5685856.1 HD domain-containing phosphohydrolase [Ideonella sp.]
MNEAVEVNHHYLDRVVALSEDSGVEASEDIMARNGMKLLAKGARIDARARARLLEYKLTKPLESMMRVVEGVGSRKIDRVAEALLERHPLLSRLCGAATGKLLSTSLRDLILTSQVDSLLSVYAAQGPAKLEHAVGIALVSAAMANQISGGPPMDLMLLAGLLHDVGEVYIDPAILAPGARLTPQQWKHVAAHPIVGARVLKDMPGAGIKVANAVLHHHERLDGFGYPAGLRGDALPLPGQVLAMAEMLIGLLEAGSHNAERAAVAVKLIPGEFNRALLDKVATAAHAETKNRPAQDDAGASVQELAERVITVYGAVQRFRQNRELIVSKIPTASASLKSLLEHAVERSQRISLAFSSTGLDSHQPDELTARLTELDANVRLEVSIVLRELQWRLREVKREVTLRSAQLSPPDAAIVQELVELTSR